jgi:tRNA nucleotidyltransferase (CCA-adding enzyme)
MSGPSYGKLAITGEDLKALGVKPGPLMGKLIKELEELVIEDPTANTTENLLTEAKKRMQ